MICSDTVEQREKALAKLEPMQQGDFEAMYIALEGRPMTVRFLDPPLHEFVPTEEADIEQLAKDMGKSVQDIKNIIASLHEGMRGIDVQRSLDDRTGLHGSDLGERNGQTHHRDHDPARRRGQGAQVRQGRRRRGR